MNILKTMSIAILMAISFSASAAAGNYTPTTSWPYIYEDFQEGCVINTRGSEIYHQHLNISLIRGKAHYLQDGELMELDMSTVRTVTIGNDKYIPIYGSLVKVIKETEHGTTALSIIIDTEAMKKQDMGYGGGSATSNSWAVSTRSIDGAVAADPKSINEISKSGGDPLILKKRKGIIYNGMFIAAAKPAIMNISGKYRDDVKKFMKDNKIKLSDDEDLSKLAEFIGTL